MSLVDYLKETKVEITHVNWPTRTQSMVFSTVVVIVSVLTAFFLGFFDFLFSKLLNLFV